MTREIVVNNRRMLINDEVIDRDIAQLERDGKVGKIEEGTYHASRPDIHGLLTCFRDQRKYDPIQIENVCLDVCPHNIDINRIADDACHLDDCLGVVFTGVSLDGTTKYIELIKS